jgi:hypothetical protein
VQRDAVLCGTNVIVEDDVLDRHLAGEYRRKQDAVVVRVRFGTKDGDVVVSGASLSSSSSVRTPAMPLPTMTSFFLLIAVTPVIASR